nr:hypothetical protein [Bradyrhizobium sp. SRL28]
MSSDQWLSGRPPSGYLRNAGELLGDADRMNLIRHGNKQSDFFSASRALIDSINGKTLLVVGRIQRTPFLLMAVSIEDKCRRLVVDQHARQERQWHRRQTAIDAQQITSIQAGFAPRQIDGKRNEFVDGCLWAHDMAVDHTLAQIENHGIAMAFQVRRHGIG